MQTGVPPLHFTSFIHPARWRVSCRLSQKTFAHFALLTLSSICGKSTGRCQEQYNTKQFVTIQYNVIQYHSIQNNTIQYTIIFIQHNTIQHNLIQFSRIHENTKQNNIIQYDINMQYNTIQYNTMRLLVCPRRKFPVSLIMRLYIIQPGRTEPPLNSHHIVSTSRD